MEARLLLLHHIQFLTPLRPSPLVRRIGRGHPRDGRGVGLVRLSSVRVRAFIDCQGGCPGCLFRRLLLLLLVGRLCLLLLLLLFSTNCCLSPPAGFSQRTHGHRGWRRDKGSEVLGQLLEVDVEGFGGQVVEMVDLRAVIVGSLRLGLRDGGAEIEFLGGLLLLLLLGWAFLLRGDCLVKGVDGGGEGVDDILRF